MHHFPRAPAPTHESPPRRRRVESVDAVPGYIRTATNTTVPSMANTAAGKSSATTGAMNFGIGGTTWLMTESHEYSAAARMIAQVQASLRQRDTLISPRAESPGRPGGALPARTLR